MPSRTIAIGDIHGCLPALEAVLERVAPQPEDLVVTLGDYVDRGPDTRGVIQRLIDLGAQCQFVPLLGNHDEMLLAIHGGRDDLLEDWLAYGGDATLASYEVSAPAEIPRPHVDFLHHCRLFYETDLYFFVHGNYREDQPLDRQPRESLLWESLKRRQPGPHRSGKIAVVGHTAQKSGRILDLGYLKCIDTWCYGDGWLTALHLETGRCRQADKKGRIRASGQGKSNEGP